MDTRRREGSRQTRLPLSKKSARRSSRICRRVARRLQRTTLRAPVPRSVGSELTRPFL